ncbi:MAG: Trm112 family protein [Planctomycetota bacterium]
MIDAKMIELLRCPAEGGGLQLAADDLVAEINQRIEQGEARDALDQRVEDAIEGGLVNESQSRLYPIRGSIPTMVADEAIIL